MTRHGIAEHHTIDKVIAEIDQTASDSPAWLALVKKLKSKVLHHLEEEEQQFFQMAGKVFSEKQKRQLAKQYQAEVVN